MSDLQHNSGLRAMLIIGRSRPAHDTRSSLSLLHPIEFLKKQQVRKRARRAEKFAGVDGRVAALYRLLNAG